MDKPEEKQIEQHVIHPSTLQFQEKQFVKKWMENDEEIRMLTKWYEEFYKRFHQVEENKAASKLAQDIVDLKLFKKTSKITNGFVLAAHTTDIEQVPRLKTIKTFISKKHKTLVRLLHDERDEHFKLYVISKYVNEGDIVLIKIYNIDTLLVSEPGGSFCIPNDTFLKNNITDWTHCHINMPIAKIRIFRNITTSQINFDTTEIKREIHDFTFKLTKEQLQITSVFKNNSYPKKAVLFSNNLSRLIDMKTGMCSIALKYLLATETYVYFYK